MNQYRSYRDPGGSVVFDLSSVWRRVAAESDSQLQTFLKLDLVREWQQDNLLIDAVPRGASEFAAFAGSEAADGHAGEAYYEHRRIDFPSFPYEWPPEMLHAAAGLTLDLAEKLLAQNWGLKDATPYNVLFCGPRPIFVDLLSFEPRDREDPIWLPYNQFVSTFLLPLLVNKRLGLPLRRIFESNRNGIDTLEAAGHFGAGAKFGPTVFSLVTLPAFLNKMAERKADLYREKRRVSAEQAAFVLKGSLKRLRRQLGRVEPDRGRHSEWTDYTDNNSTNQPAYMAAKESLVRRLVETQKPRRVLSIGCNTGHFSFISARAGGKVVAIDRDPAVVGRMWQMAAAEGLDVLPLVIDLAQPSPATGWRNSETPSFCERARGHFDLVTMLAVLHHLLVTDRIPLNEVLRFMSELTTDTLLIEYVPPDDPMFRRIARGREHLHADLNTAAFEAAAKEFFDIFETTPLPETSRVMYMLKKK